MQLSCTLDSRMNQDKKIKMDLSPAFWSDSQSLLSSFCGEAILADACHVVGLVVSRVGQLVASPVAVLQVAPTLAAAVGTAVVGVKRPCVVEHPALEHHVDVAPWIEGGSRHTQVTTLDRLMRLEFYQHVQKIPYLYHTMHSHSWNVTCSFPRESPQRLL